MKMLEVEHEHKFWIFFWMQTQKKLFSKLKNLLNKSSFYYVVFTQQMKVSIFSVSFLVISIHHLGIIRFSLTFHTKLSYSHFHIL